MLILLYFSEYILDVIIVLNLNSGPSSQKHGPLEYLLMILNEYFLSIFSSFYLVLDDFVCSCLEYTSNIDVKLIAFLHDPLVLKTTFSGTESKKNPFFNWDFISTSTWC